MKYWKNQATVTVHTLVPKQEAHNTEQLHAWLIPAIM